MTARNSKGVKVRVLKSTASGIGITPTGATKAKPSQIATADTDTMAVGDMLVFASNSTALLSLDGKAWIAGAVVADTTFDLLGSDASADTGTFAAGADILLYKDADFQTLCLSTFTLNPGSPSTISVGTFCDTTASIPSAVVEAGTVDIGGYIDITDLDYQLLIDWDKEGGARQFRIDLPSNGYLLFEATMANLNWDIPVDGALAWNAQLTLAGKPRHLF